MKIIFSGLPVFLRDSNKKLSFEDGLVCDGDSSKMAGQMEGLLRFPDNMNKEEWMYSAYRNIRFPADEEIFRRYDIRYDITAIQPGTINGEFKKTSGHYHGYIAGSVRPYPEVYEVVKGEILFVLQKSLNFDKKEEPIIEDLKIILAKEGQVVIIPPYYGHGSINPLDTISIFSNLAVVSCPLHYEPIKQKHGLAVYVLKSDDSFEAVPNENYQNLPDCQIVEPVESLALGIEFGVPCYSSFINHPERYDFLLHPDSYIDSMNKMTQIR